MNGIIIYNTASAEQNKHYIDLYFRACEKRGIILKLVLTEQLSYWAQNKLPYIKYLGKAMDMPDFAIMRTPDITLACYLESFGVKVFNNSDVIRTANDKRLTYLRASEANIPIMDTYYNITSASDIDEYPVVVKPAHGCGGRGVTLAHSRTELSAALRAISPDAPVIQKLASDVGRDLRVYFVGNEIICAMLRSSDSDFRSNYGLGGSASLHELTEDERRLAMRVASLFELSYAGVDFIFDKGCPVFNEVEDAVGARMLYANTAIDIVDLYVDHIYKKVGVLK